jgi:PadR family transcriptional regulator AphA
MSLRHALLGLLIDQPSSGYELTQRFAEGIGSYAWSARHSQIYPELKKLLDQGLIEMVDEGARGRRTYAITAEGRAELRGWLLDPPTGSGVRNEFVLRLFLLSALEADEAAELLQKTVAHCERQLDLLNREFDGLVADGSASGGAPGLAAQYGLHAYRATIDWARWAITALEQDGGVGASPVAER